MLPNRNQLEQLSKFTYPCVSMYLPTHMAGADTRENAIRFKNRLQDAERQLQALGFRRRQCQRLFERRLCQSRGQHLLATPPTRSSSVCES